jgi:hypothetical protein
MKTWTDEQLINAVKTSNKMCEVIKKLGLTALGRNYTTINNYIKKLALDTSHFLSRRELACEARKHINKLTNDELFAVNDVNRNYIKRIILKEHLIEYECQICKITNWCGQKLSLHLDHINGINNDNRLDNLRFLCPNCHSLTETYCAKNKRKPLRV